MNETGSAMFASVWDPALVLLAFVTVKLLACWLINVISGPDDTAEGE